VHLQRGRRDGSRHPPGVAQAVGAQLRTGRPSVVLHRAVGGLRDAGGRPVPVHRRGEVRRARPGGTRPALHEVGDRVVIGAGQPSLGQPRDLEAEGVPRRPSLGRVGDAGPQPARVGHGEDHQPAHGTGVQRRHGPAEQPTPVVADDDGVLLAECAHQRRHVGRQRREVVAAGRLVAGAVAAQIGGDHVEAGVGQTGELRSPGPPELGETVQQEDQRSLTRLGGVQPHAVGGDVAMGPRAWEQDARGVRLAVHRFRHGALRGCRNRHPPA
jgi:hypothetical protein